MAKQVHHLGIVQDGPYITMSVDAEFSPKTNTALVHLRKNGARVSRYIVRYRGEFPRSNAAKRELASKFYQGVRRGKPGTDYRPLLNGGEI